MSGDYSRYGFDPTKDFDAVLLQQGRPMTDRDWNDEAVLVDRRIQAGSYDTLGQAVVPSSTPNAFALTFDAGGNLQIGPGRMYVDGLLVENHGTGTPKWDPALGETFGSNPTPYFPPAPPAQGAPYMPNPPALPAAGAPAIAYLDVWQREVTQFEDASILEPALGTDTTTRRQTVWQVKFLANMAAGTDCATDLSKNQAWLSAIAPSGGRLTTAAGSVPGQDNPCLIPPASGYTGLENQLYRVEIQAGGGLGTATFKWSRDNGSVVARVTQIVDPTHIVVDSVGKDDVLRFSDGDWIEITDDWREFAGLPGELHQIVVGGGVDDATRIITLTSAITAGLFPTHGAGLVDASRHTRIRRWDQQGKVLDATGALYVDLGAAGSTGAITVPTGGKTLLLENGVLVTFSIDPAGGSFQPGDYWVFAARASDGTVETLTSASPRGIHHHYAKLAVVTFPNTIKDCRVMWPPAIGGGECACSVCVTPAKHADGSYTLQKAVSDVSANGGTVCLEPGTYALAQPVTVSGAHAVNIVGQGPATVLQPTAGAFTITGGNAITISDLLIQGGAQLTGNGDAAILVSGTTGLMIQRARIQVRAKTGIAVAFTTLPINATIKECLFQSPSGIVYVPPAAPAPNNPLAPAAGTTATAANAGATPTAAPAATTTAVPFAATNIRLTDNASLAGAAASANTGPSASVTAAAAAGAATTPAGTTATGAASDTTNVANTVATVALTVEENLFATSLDAITIVAQGATAFAMVVARNRIALCSVWGIGLQAPVQATSYVDIAENEMTTAAPGIVVGVNGLHIRNNDILFSGTAKGPQDGITIFPLFSSDFLDDCQIVGNRISGFGAAGVGIRGPANRVLVKQNQIGQTGAGIALEYAAISTRQTGSISIENNQLTDIAAAPLSSDAAPTTIATAIWVHNAAAVHVAGNTILRLATAMPVAQSRVAILVWGSDGAHILGNNVSDVAPSGSYTGPATGVSILEPFGAIDIADNQIRRYSATATQPAADTGEWIPIVVLGTLPTGIANPAFLASGNFANFAAANTMKTDLVATNLRTVLKIAPGGLAAAPPPPLPLTTERVAVRGNQLEGFGSAPISLVSGPLDCVFSENHCLLATPASQLQSSVDVILAGNTVIASNNRIAGGATSLSITVPRNTACSVLGNLTHGGITVGGASLAAPWNALNVVGL